jgi:hypothetical protein
MQQLSLSRPSPAKPDAIGGASVQAGGTANVEAPMPENFVAAAIGKRMLESLRSVVESTP